MKLKYIDHTSYLDGGTLVIETDKGTFYVDRALQTKTPEAVYCRLRPTAIPAAPAEAEQITKIAQAIDQAGLDWEETEEISGDDAYENHEWQQKRVKHLLSNVLGL